MKCYSWRARTADRVKFSSFENSIVPAAAKPHAKDTRCSSKPSHRCRYDITWFHGSVDHLPATRMLFSPGQGGVVIEIMSHVELSTPMLALQHQQLARDSILAGHAVDGATYKLRCQVIPDPADNHVTESSILILLLVNNIWQMGGVLGSLNSPALVS